jgi:hypothetical protein
MRGAFTCGMRVRYQNDKNEGISRREGRDNSKTTLESMSTKRAVSKSSVTKHGERVTYGVGM